MNKNSCLIRRKGRLYKPIKNVSVGNSTSGVNWNAMRHGSPLIDAGNKLGIAYPEFNILYFLTFQFRGPALFPLSVDNGWCHTWRTGQRTNCLWYDVSTILYSRSWYMGDHLLVGLYSDGWQWCIPVWSRTVSMAGDCLTGMNNIHALAVISYRR